MKTPTRAAVRINELLQVMDDCERPADQLEVFSGTECDHRLPNSIDNNPITRSILLRQLDQSSGSSIEQFQYDGEVSRPVLQRCQICLDMANPSHIK